MAVKSDLETNTYTLTINQLVSSDSGTYFLKAKNVIGECTTTCQLTVLVPPKFVKPLSLSSSTAPVTISEIEEDVQVTKLSVNEKSQIKIECQVTGLPKPNVKWLRNDMDIRNDDKMKLENKQEMYALAIKDCSIKEKGAYVVVAENEIGTAKNKIYVDINNIPILVKGLTNLEIELQENLKVELICTYKSKPVGEIFWFFGDKPLKDGDEDQRYLILDEAGKDEEGNDIQITKLKINGANLSDSGLYKCKIKNCAGEVNTNATLTIIKGAQIIESLPELLEIPEKKEIKFICKILDSVPKSTITWNKDGNQLNNTKKYVIGKPVIDEVSGSFIHTLAINDASANDSGAYSVKASNKVSTVESKCNVFVISPPKIVKDLKPNLECAENDKVHIEVNAAGRPLPEFKWYHFNTETNSEEEVLNIDGQINTQVQSENIYSIDFFNIKQEMKGKYTLRLNNKAGSVETSCNIVVNGKKI